jgi:mannosyltransferase OCH1-like enzyme
VVVSRPAGRPIFHHRNGGTDVIKKLHFIWLGRVIPHNEQQPYLSRIAKWSQANTDWKVYLWYHTDTLKNDEKSFYTWMANSKYGNIHFKDISKKTTYTPGQDKLAGLNDMFIDELFHQCPNYGAASDILRVALLLKHGGLYLDTDVGPNPQKALGALTAPLGFLINSPAQGAFSNDVLYAGTNGHPFFVKYRDQMVVDYKKQSAKKKFANRRTDKEQKLDWTMEATGPGCLTQVVLDLKYQAQGPAILFPKDRILQGNAEYGSDASWL